MYSIDELNVQLLSELREIAEKIGIKNSKKISKGDLVYKILDQQATMSDEEIAKHKAELGHSNGKEAEEAKPKKKETKAKKVEKEDDKSADELLESFNLELDNIDTPASVEKEEEEKKESGDQEEPREKKEPRPKREDSRGPRNKERSGDSDNDRKEGPRSEGRERPERRNRDRGDRNDRNDQENGGRPKRSNYNQDIKEFDGTISNEGVLEIMQDGLRLPEIF